jgi:hypothetical protein
MSGREHFTSGVSIQYWYFYLIFLQLISLLLFFFCRVFVLHFLFLALAVTRTPSSLVFALTRGRVAPGATPLWQTTWDDPTPRLGWLSSVHHTRSHTMHCSVKMPGVGVGDGWGGWMGTLRYPTQSYRRQHGGGRGTRWAGHGRARGAVLRGSAGTSDQD